MISNKLVEWCDSYSLGIRLIDNQHKNLFKLVNRLYEPEAVHGTKDDMKKIVYEFSDYMQTHFEEEEEYMLSLKYPLLEEHKKLHQDLIDSLVAVIKTSTTLDVMRTKMKIIVKRSLIYHITQEDIKIKTFQDTLGNDNSDISEV